ncbi:MAG: hypothetical protein ACM31L_02580 [Actinomycetota bacterium]
MTSSPILLPANSAFSRLVFETIRPRIPKQAWPDDHMVGAFRPTADGLAFDATFEGLPPTYAAVATALVREVKTKLMVLSPAVDAARGVVAAKRWRDAFLYLSLPLLFAIPLMAALTPLAMRMAAGAFMVDLAALGLAQGLLAQRRELLAATSFMAEIPVPGMRLRLTAEPVTAIRPPKMADV